MASMSAFKEQDYRPLNRFTLQASKFQHLPPHEILLATSDQLLTSCPGSTDTLLDFTCSRGFDRQLCRSRRAPGRSHPSGPDSASSSTYSHTGRKKAMSAFFFTLVSGSGCVP